LATPWAARAQPGDFFDPIFSCAKSDNIEYLQRILDFVPDWNADESFDFKQALRACSSSGSLACLEALARAGAYLGHRDRSDHTLLTAAIFYDNEPLFDKLLELGADPNDYEPNPLSHTHRSLSVAVYKNRFDYAKRLLAAGANPNVLNENGCTILGNLATLRMVDENLDFQAEIFDIARALLAAGANIDMYDSEGHTPLLNACENGTLPFAKFLLEHGADHRLPTLSNEPPLRPLDYCISRRKIDNAILLTEYDQDMTEETWERLIAQASASLRPEHEPLARARHEAWLLKANASPASTHSAPRSTL
jgi:ankyrin repeat protein